MTKLEEFKDKLKDTPFSIIYFNNAYEVYDVICDHPFFTSKDEAIVENFVYGLSYGYHHILRKK